MTSLWCLIWENNFFPTSNQFFERNSMLVMIAKMAEGIFPSVNRIIINVNVKRILFSLVECSLMILIFRLIFFDVFVIKIGGFFFLEIVPNLSISSSLMVGLNCMKKWFLFKILDFWGNDSTSLWLLGHISKCYFSKIFSYFVIGNFAL